MKDFAFSGIPHTIFGIGSIKQLGKVIPDLTKKILLITGDESYRKTGIQEEIEPVLNAGGFILDRYPVNSEPSPELVDEITRSARPGEYELVIAVGGGSVMDAGKAVAAMAKEEGSVKDFLEEVGTKIPSGRRLGLILIPTTAGTGSEATKNAVISQSGPGGFKKSLRHKNYIPDVAILDPGLSLKCPPELTAASGMDAFTQLLEAYLSVKAGELTDTLALAGLERINRSLYKAYLNGSDGEARSNMVYAAYLSGVVLANAGLGVVHGFAQPLGSLFPVPHGVVCGTLMATVNRITVSKLRKDDPGSPVLGKYVSVGRLFCGEKITGDMDAVDKLLDTMDDLTERMRLPRLAEFGIVPSDFAAIIERTEHKNHPVNLSDDELSLILKQRL
jgi:alcohol dehydrogenase class IV